MSDTLYEIDLNAADRQPLQESIQDLPAERQMTSEALTLLGLTAVIAQPHSEVSPDDAVPPTREKVPETVRPPAWYSDSVKSTPKSTSSNENDILKLYLNEMGQVPLLEVDQELELAKIIEAGRSAQATLEDDSSELAPSAVEDIQRTIEEASRAHETFITSNLRLVVSIARRYPVPPGMELLDLIQEGNFGLERAVEKFDWRKGCKFSTYATRWIKDFITNALHVDSRLIRLPREPSMELRAGLLAVGGNGDQLQDPEIARLHALSTTVSLDYTYDEMSQGTTLGERLPSNIPGPEQALFDRLEREQATAFIDDLLQTLDDGPRRIAVIGRLGLNGSPPLSNEEVGRILGVTTEAAQKLYLRGLDTICAAQGVKRPKRRRSKPPDKE